MSGWTPKTLADVVTLQRGHDLPATKRGQGRVPVIGSFGVTGFHDVAKYTGPGVAIGRSGASIGVATFVQDDYWPLNTALFVKDFKSNDPRWVYYLLDSIDFMAFNSGSAQPSLNRNYLAHIEVNLPPVSEQRAIADTLGMLDDKIESNMRTVETLEELGATLLEEELELDVYGFPEYRSDLRLGDMVSVFETGSRPKGGASAEGQGVVSLGAESIQSAGFTNTTRFKKIPREFVEGMRRGRLTDGDVLVYKDGGSPGNFIPHISAFGYGFPVDEAAINEHVYRVRGSDEVSQGLLYWLLRSPWMDGEMRKRGTGVAIPGLNSTNFRDLPWPVISTQTERVLNDTLQPMLVLMLRLGAENRRIALLRDVLLPVLLSGRIRVPIEGVEV